MNWQSIYVERSYGTKDEKIFKKESNNENVPAYGSIAFPVTLYKFAASKGSIDESVKNIEAERKKKISKGNALRKVRVGYLQLSKTAICRIHKFSPNKF